MASKSLESLFGLTGRVAIVTGGTRGIGLAVAEGLAAAGAKVLVASRKAEACRAAELRLRTQGSEALGIPAHVGDITQLRTLVDKTVDAYGGIDIVINSAAIAIGAPLGRQTAELWQKSFEVNVRGPVFLVQEALPYLKDGTNPAVLNIVSSAAFLHAPGVSLYAASKAALVSLTRSMAAEFASFGIRVNALCPGTTDTDMIRGVPDDELKAMVRKQLIPRVASAHEMVGPALLLVSHAGSFVTGQVTFADGGLVTAR